MYDLIDRRTGKLIKMTDSPDRLDVYSGILFAGGEVNWDTKKGRIGKEEYDYDDLILIPC